MTPNFFFDCGYTDPYGACAYEYSRQDSENKVDYSGWYHPSMVDAGMISQEGLATIEQYRGIPGRIADDIIGLEIDCGAPAPAVFLPFQTTRPGAQATIAAMSEILGCDEPLPMPVLPMPDHLLQITEVGMFPSRGFKLLRFAVRARHVELKQFADDNGCINTDIITNPGHTHMNSAVSFDWDGTTMTNFTFYSPHIYVHDRWVHERTLDATANIDKLYAGRNYRIDRHIKVGLSPHYPANYMKIYFSVRQPDLFTKR